MGRKLRDSRGETLVELLASILIAALSVALLFTCCLASAEMDENARKSDERYYKALSEAEAQTQAAGGDPVNVKVEGNSTSTTIDAILYGGEDMYSYRWKKGG